MKLVFSTLLILVAAIAIVSAQNCKLNAYGKNYDFSKLANSTSWSVQDASKATYYFNICQTASKCTTINPQCSVCQQGPTDTQPKADCGHVNAIVNSLSNGVAGGYITYTGGSTCKSGTIVRSTQIQMMCTSGPTQILSATEISTCTFTIKLNSNLACPTQAATTTTTTSSSWNSTTGSPTSSSWNSTTTSSATGSPTTSSWNSTTGAPFTTDGTTTFSPTTTTTTSPSNGSVTTHTTTTSDDYLTTTNTVTTRVNYDSYVVINTTTVSSDTATFTITVTTIKSGEISNIVTTTTYTEGTSTTTDTQTQKKRLGLNISPEEIEPSKTNDSSSLKSNSLILIVISAFILLLSSF
ncbi:hypothetical protein PPL_08642 [Heterostelium album PN500]|uniref:MRH domain-containing protein n=1 Tax=Heterostelium pallidum (strain ATCC 26659 / Pp 5 / PN500) TaxID=670386 RepID=D3BJB7_HETP5|nr:hypothetical protein PPL_08642 [Heterostelium album PN500]EFA77997.1 hypothetical protein PPL_08642 [Heterostelium album PN500]|eukprot:XP_020430125.1 hypothetical protein PPL_08642 [Heterostelium album PN500]